MPRKKDAAVLSTLLVIVFVYADIKFISTDIKFISNINVIANVSCAPKVPYSLGNWTYVTKPVYPVKINASQISVGSNWTLVYALNQDSLYNIYSYGD